MKSAFGSERMADLDRARLQQFLDRLAKDYCYDTVHLAHTYLRAIFRLAVDEGWLPKNPARTLAVPKTTRDRDETILSLESVQLFEDELNGSDRIIWQLLSRCGLRAGEVFGLQWQDLRQDQALRIQRIYARGKVSELKTKKSKASIAVPAAVYREVLKMRESTSDTSEGRWLFPSSRKRRGTLMPLDYHNWLNRVLKPLGDRLGIRVNHQILRRTFASLAYNTGGDLKDIQAQMRHASVNTTANIYTKPILKSVRRAVEALDRRIRRRGQAKKS
jgi:integrase